MSRFTAKTVFLGLVRACRLAIWPTSRSPLAVKPTMEGVVRAPSWLGMTWGAPPSMTATQELVVPRSIPITLPTRDLSMHSLQRHPRGPGPVKGGLVYLVRVGSASRLAAGDLDQGGSKQPVLEGIAFPEDFHDGPLLVPGRWLVGEGLVARGVELLAER